MIITVDLNGVVGLDDPADCKRFHLAARGDKDEAGLAAALARSGVGRLHDTDALIEISAVRRLAEGRVSDGWADDFDGMLDYARTKGWVHGDAIQAHIEWESA